MYPAAVPGAVVLRRIVLLWFAILGLFQGARAALWFLQGALNVVWETGFYGAPSVHTSAVLAWSVFVVNRSRP